MRTTSEKFADFSAHFHFVLREKWIEKGWNMDSELPPTIESRPSTARKRKWKQCAPQGTSVGYSTTRGEKSPTKKLFKSDRRTDPSISSHKDFFMRLPDELPRVKSLGHAQISQIVLYLRPPSIAKLAVTCKRFNDVIGQNHIWKALFRDHFRMWRSRPRDLRQLSSEEDWKRQYCLNYTKGITYHLLGSGNARRKNLNQISDTPLAFGFKKLCATRDHVFGLDMVGCLHVYRSKWERDTFTNELVYRRTEWHQEFARHVIDVTTDPRYDNNHRRYVYVLTQSEAMRMRRSLPHTRSSGPSTGGGWNDVGAPVSGDKIDVFDERSCRRVFNMTFDPEMRFVSMKLTSFSQQQKTLFILTDAGKVYSLQLYESSLLNLGSEGMQVTLKSASKTLGEKVCKVETSVGVVGFLTESGKLHAIVQRKSEFADIFGRNAQVKLGLPQVIPHVAKVVHCSIGDRHLGFIDEYNRVFVLGNNRYGQLGTGDRMDRSSPVQVLCGRRIRILYCSLNHTMAVEEHGGRCKVLGTGCGYNGRLPGKHRGCVEFTILEIKVPWGVRQVDAHKETLFLLSCWDTDSQDEYKKQEDGFHPRLMESLALKSPEELLIEMKKGRGMVEKLRVVEAMVDKLSHHRPKSEHGSSARSGHHQSPSSNVNGREVGVLRRAVEELRLEVERDELDRRILSSRVEQRSNVQ